MQKPLTNPNFFKELVLQIKKAKQEIIIVNYIAEIKESDSVIPEENLIGNPADLVIASEAWQSNCSNDPIIQIAKDLIKAKKRGVKVSILLEGSKFQESYVFYQIMKQADVDIWLDTSKSFIHHKLVIIDNKLCFVGSHNLSYASMQMSEESSVLTNHQVTIKCFKKEIKKITKQREDIRQNICKKKIKLPSGFLMHAARPLYKARAVGAFTLYLSFFRQGFVFGDKIPIQEEKWCKLLGYDILKASANTTKHYKNNYYKQRINRVLYQLKDRFNLIIIDRKSDTVTMQKLPKGDRALEIPDTYWQYNWIERLSLRANYFYFISLNETENSPFYPWWQMPIREIEKKYKCDHGISQGARELADYNILEILRSIPVKRRGGYSEEAQFYRVNPFYNIKVFENRLKKLEKKFSKPALQMSQKIAKLFWESHDLEVIEKISKLTKKYGIKRLKKEHKFLSKLRTSSSRRTLEYLQKRLS